MRMLLTVFAASLAAVPVFADVNASAAAEKPKKVNKKLLVTGGSIKIPGTQKGLVALLNCQNRAKEEWLSAAADEMASLLRCEFSVRRAAVPSGGLAGMVAYKEKEGLNLAMFAIDSDESPAGLAVYPEQGIVVVNFAPVVKDVKEGFFEMRCKKEISRGIAYLCGGGSSQYPDSVLGAVTKPGDMDLSFNEQIPFDAIQKFPRYMKAFGISPYQKTTYRKACQEGWAPAPTNDIQKAVWERVASEKEKGPANAIKIAPPAK